jgi:hypothetical protein
MAAIRATLVVLVQLFVAVVARVSNAVDHQGDQFDTGTNQDGLRLITAIVRAGERFLNTSGPPEKATILDG